MTLIVEVHVDFEVMMKYLALKWRCMEVKALATTLAFAAPSTYDSNLEPDPVPCCVSSMYATKRVQWRRRVCQVHTFYAGQWTALATQALRNK
mmetsp:Transcript_26684/g.48358  ORF Transcript_26684/g.48358 Transcript_26684/m.48358 type:complete len:93 (+) Transcript_26684:796-1074(+)